jgi:propionyl-CoA carboxylase alpha chain
MFYDPMIAKLVTHGDNRDEAIARMQDALDAYCIRGVSHNISFLNAVISKDRFRQGKLSTGFIAEEYPNGFHASDVPREDPGLLIALAATVHRRFMDRAAKLSGQLPSHERRVGSDFVVIVNREHHATHVLPAEGGYEIRFDGRHYHVVTAWQMGQPLLKAEVNGHRACVQVDRVGIRYRLFHRGSQIDALVVTPGTATMERLMLAKQPPDLSKFLLSPMPGLLKRLAVKVGDEIKAGEELAVVEAMKMENSLRATADVVVSKLLATEGQSLAVDQPILAFE